MSHPVRRPLSLSLSLSLSLKSRIFAKESPPGPISHFFTVDFNHSPGMVDLKTSGCLTVSDLLLFPLQQFLS